MRRALTGLLDDWTPVIAGADGAPVPVGGFVVRADGSVDRLDAGGPVLGVFPDSVYERHNAILKDERVIVVAVEESARRVGPSSVAQVSVAEPVQVYRGLVVNLRVEDVVGLPDLLEALGRRRVVAVDVGVVLAGQAPVGALDVLRPGAPVDLQQLVVVAHP